MRVRFGLAVLVVTALVAAACGDSNGGAVGGEGCAKDQLNLVEPGVLTIATGEPAFPPWIIDDDPTNKQGFEGEIAYAIAEKLGFADNEVVWVRTGFDEAIAPGPKDFDFNLQQYSIREDRDEVVDFSIPYYTTSQALVAYDASAFAGAETVDDLKGNKLGAAIGTTSLSYIEDVIQPDEAAAVYDTNADAKAALDAGQIDAIVIDVPIAIYITGVELPDLSIVGVLEASEGQADEYGLLFAEGNPLVECINGALEELESEGKLAEFAAEWLEGAGDLPVLSR